MKRYRLNKDWLPFAKGTKFLKTEDSGDMYTLEDNTGVLTKIPTDLLDEINDSGCWKPKALEYYYFADDSGILSRTSFCPDVDYDQDRISLGNCFRTREDAQAVVDWLRARQRLIESGARFINFLNATPEDKYCRVVFNRMEDYLQVIEGCLDGIIVQEKELLFSERSLAKQSIKEHKDDWLIYLGVKEKSDTQTDA